MSAHALVNDVLPTDVPVAGTILAGSYRVDGRIGGGGMGTILRATELASERPVAIKLLTAAAASDPEQVARFRREAKAAASLTSQHVVRVLDSGELDSGLPFLVMEHLEGESLVELLKARGRLDVAEAVDFVLQAVHGIAEAHALGIVHRDIKPANLFVTGDADTPVVKVIDFGASKLTAESSVDPSDPGGVTIASSLIGSPRYMAPEQIRSALEVDARADVYALGATLHELLSGKPIFFADTLARIFAQVLWDAPEPLSATRDDVPAELAAVIAKCLAKAPDERYSTVEALAVELAPFGGATRRSSGVAPVMLARTSEPAASEPGPSAAEPLPAPAIAAPSPPRVLPKPTAASGSKLIAARLFKPDAPAGPERAHLAKRKATSAAKAAVVLKSTARMPRVRSVSEAPKRTVRIAAFALAARLGPAAGAAPAADADAGVLARRARTVRMERYDVGLALAPAGALSPARRFPRARVILVMIVAFVAICAALGLARHRAHVATSPTAHGGR